MVLSTMPNPFNSIIPAIQLGRSYASGFGGLGYSAVNQASQDIKADTQTIWEREDSAYQRMVADMKKAGLNPWTGVASGGLSTGSSNPSSDAFNALIAGLSLNGEIAFRQNENNNRNIKSVLNIIDTVFDGIRSIGKMI